ncbi:MAG: PIN domain-containing protein [Clostridiales bacterium]|nr:PIN domain-containing protein [Clostridiales bacterium]
MSKKIKVYLDTSIISYTDQQDAPEKMLETKEVWEILRSGKYDIYISDIVLEELGKCGEPKLSILISHLEELKYHIIETNENTVDLAEKIIDFGVLKRKSFDDCRHIAAAILSGCDIIVSWNFKHLVNVKTVRGIKVITTLEGFKDILIYPPTALLEDEEDD